MTPNDCCRACGEPNKRYRPKRRICRDCDAAAARERRALKKEGQLKVAVPPPQPKPRWLPKEPREQGPSILVVPDGQCGPDTPTWHWAALGRYINRKRPGHVVFLGDHWDWGSLSSYDGALSKAAAGYNTDDDYDAGCRALMLMFSEVENFDCIKWHFAMGNHENRRDKAVKHEPHISIKDPRIALWGYGFEVHEFLDVFEIEGVHFSHYFCRNAQGTVTQSKRGMASAAVQGKREMRSCIAGHKQGLDTAIIENGWKRVRSIICGSFYDHDEDYLTGQGVQYWRGVLMLNDVRDGDYELCEVSLEYLRRVYGCSTRSP